ncbi:MAG: hypothetical protein A2Z95_06190 [Gallionellales bacterium GWA2_60_18]|nr:MAG: hypothetical protein A2Z95_06190 [Gallionellales bacterium GWA2_60_18]
MSGASLSFSEADLAATAAAYDPAKHEAPIVIGHPKHDGPAYGWVKSLAFTEGLDAESHQVDPAFADMVARGAFKKVSASFYSPDSPSNPVPGVYYLRHVGFLGAQPPAVKGLRNPSFAEAEEGVIEFADWGDVQNASILRSLREWIIGKFGLDEADKAIPGYAVQTVEQEANKEDAAPEAVAAPAFTEPQPPQGETMSAEDKARLAALEIENAALKAKDAAFAEAEKKRASDARHTEHVAFAEGLVKEGKLLPAHKDSTVATLDFMAGQETAVEFGEGDAKKPLIEAHKAFLLAQPKQVDFGEASGTDKGDALDANDATAVAAKAVEFQEAEAKAGRTISVTAAVNHVTKGSK